MPIRLCHFQCCILLALAMILFAADGYAQEEDTTPVTDDPFFLSLITRQRIKLSDYEYRYVWEDGFYYYDPFLHMRLRMNLWTMLDAEGTTADQELQEAFPDLEGWKVGFRRVRLNTQGTFYDALEFKFDLEFANLSDIKDLWVRYLPNNFLKRLRFGHMKEPYSLAANTSSKYITFMERPLPVDVLAPFRNLGVRYDGASSDERITWALGGFWTTGSLGSVGDVQDQIKESTGYSLCGRLTCLPSYGQDGRDLVHLALNLRYMYSGGNDIRLSGRPESYLTDERLVDTGKFQVESGASIDLELASVHGPLSFQGEVLQDFYHAHEAGDPTFWGFYFLTSYFLTGENRNYYEPQGIFAKVTPNRKFGFREGGWGAWEAGLRFSYLDLNSGKIQGGKEANLTAGLNWYWASNIRFMFNYVHANVWDRGVQPEVEDGRANIFQTRFQVIF